MPALAADEVDAATVVGRVALVVLPLVLAFFLVHASRRVIPRTVARVTDASRGGGERLEQRTHTLSATLTGLVATVVWLLAGLTSLAQLGLNLAPLLAGAGVVGLAVGFGAQQLVRDVIGGFFILVEDQYGVGDSVTIAGVTGTIESMSLRLTRIRGNDGVLHHVRNGDLGVVSNASRGWAMATVTVPVASGTDPAVATERLRDAMARVVSTGGLDQLLLADPQVLGLTEASKDGGIIEITARTTPESRSRVQRELLAAALDALSARPARKGAATKRVAGRR